MPRRSRSGGNQDESTIDLTPMLDVTFILLIFFIVTAQFIKEPGVPIDRQDVRNDERVTPLAILIGIDKVSKIYINKKEVNPNEVTFFIRELRRDNPKGQIVVQVDKQSKAAVMDAVMTSIQEADPTAKVHIATAQD